MELRQLEYFVTVAEEANFTRAAARLHVAQPGVSAQVRRLERELGEELLDRSGRTVRLTEVGAAVLPYARAALDAVSGARDAVAEFTGLVRGHVTAGMVASMSTHAVDLPGLLAGFHRLHPAVEITLSEAGSGLLLEGLLAGRLDVAFVGLAGDPPPEIDIQVITDEPLVAIVGPTDPLATRKVITLKELAGRALIGLPRGTGLRACVDDAFTAADLRPHFAFEAGDPRLLARLAGRGLGVAVLPESVMQGRTAELHAIALRPGIRGRLAFAWRAEGPVGPAARTFVGHVRAALTAGLTGEE
ncbi:LysR substrate-binding domain-containing protein [Actinoallomurus bryophytorum]|uniref:DNA-binding transcriptional LysR family regulator n=1 Tax=Actinoallomurus bryophytorum TaxID=1490222 RepID=A0A543CGS2_9ACTN|nr:LysR family transcriptional regulator [Actinoallomurus bryophytorum]TQL96285.1 DNA-binding transcriptional LysR family regulator [Actinoallomurus bryophytorum]